MQILLQEPSFDAGALLNAFTAGAGNIGAVVSFTGVVRDHPQTPLTAMEIEHYPGMTERALEEIAKSAVQRWSLGDVLVVHRFGRLTPGEQIMMVAAAAPHRRDAFDAADFLMDYLKSRAPFWKREITAQGPQWVQANPQDEDALARWSKD